MKAFKKGDLATMIVDWDGMGTVMIEHVTVYSCGKVQMVLTSDSTGKEIGDLFKPVKGENQNGHCHIVDRLTYDDAYDFALEYATKMVEERTGRERGRVQHEPRVIMQ